MSGIFQHLYIYTMKKESVVHNVEYIKRQAKIIKKQKNITHHQALDLTVEKLGYENWRHFLNSSNYNIENNKSNFIKPQSQLIESIKKVNPYRNLLIGAVNILIEKEILPIDFLIRNSKLDHGYILVELFDHMSVIQWHNIGFGEFTISVWWKYDHQNHPQANLTGNAKEKFRTTQPLAKKQNYKKFVGVTASAYLEWNEIKHLQGTNKEGIFDLYTRKGELDELINLPVKKPNNYSIEGPFYF